MSICVRTCVLACVRVWMHVCVFVRVCMRALAMCLAVLRVRLREYVRECNTLYETMAVLCVRVNVCRRAHVRTFVCMMPLNDAAQLTQPG